MELQKKMIPDSLQVYDRLFYKTSFYYDLPSHIDKIKKSQSWFNGELCSVVLSKRNTRKIILTAMHSNTEIISYQLNDSVTLQVIEGQLHVQTQMDDSHVSINQLLTIHEKTKYKLTATEDTIFLLTITTRLI